MAIVWSSEGADDFLAALEYLHGRNPAAARKLAKRVDDALEKLRDLPIDGPERMLSSGERVRSWPVPPFRIYYQRRDDDLLVLRMYHQKRAPIEER